MGQAGQLAQMGQMGHPGHPGQAAWVSPISSAKPTSMKNILVSLKNLVTAKKQNKPQPTTAADPPSASSASLRCNPSPVNPSSRRLTGKVAQLPHDIRTQVNQRLYNGVTYQKI